MSTSAQIGFYAAETDPLDLEGTVYLYQHYDGSPEGVLPVLLPFARAFHKKRGLDDTAYATARCLVALAQAMGSGEEEPQYLGLGADTRLHGYSEFFYHVSPTRIGIFTVSWDGKNPPTFRLTNTVALPPPVSPPVPAGAGEAQ